MKYKYKDGISCNHKDCLNHVTHPCECCGRIGGKTIELDPYHFHEAIDRVEMLREITENSLQSHVVIASIPSLRKDADKIQDSLAILYSEIEKERERRINSGLLIFD